MRVLKRVRFLFALLVGFAVILQCGGGYGQGGAAWAYSHGGGKYGKVRDISTIDVSQLPPEAKDTLKLIKQGGPFPFRKDGTVFGNREGRLPRRSKGYYKEYTVKTPASRDRGARRIIAGNDGEYYYTDDHYNTFRLIRGALP